MRTLICTLAVAALCTAACGTGRGAVAAAPSPPPVGAEACRAFDAALAPVRNGLDGHADPAIIRRHGPPAAARMRTAARLASGQARAAMDEAAEALDALADAERSAQPLHSGYRDTGHQAAAVRSAVAEVGSLCRAAGAPLRNAPAPAVGDPGWYRRPQSR